MDWEKNTVQKYASIKHIYVYISVIGAFAICVFNEMDDALQLVLVSTRTKEDLNEHHKEIMPAKLQIT